VLFPLDVDLRAVIMMFDWGFFLYFPVWQHIGLSLDQAHTSHARDAARADADAALDAFRQGQDEVISLVRRARDDAHQQLARLTLLLPAPHQDLANRRLEEVDLRLAAIGPAGG
jgi:hypothetical protein